MQISCERCGTTYALDERLIPPGGAPVQCTRCGHVFNAMPPGAAPQKEAGRTMMFGGGAPDPSKAATEMYSVPPGQAQAPNPKATQMFGAVGGVAPEPNRTQMFGAAPAAAAPKSTQMFGAVGTPQVPAAANPKATQMFGAVGGPQASAPASSTQMFGAVRAPQAPAAANPKATQMFGAVGGPQVSAPASSTQMFGAVSAPQAPAAANPKATQMFGAVGGPQASAPASSTQMFGAVSAPQAPAAAPKATQMFGAVGTPQAPAPAPTTQMFGAVKTPQAPAPASTQMFGAVSAPQAPASAPKATQMFGAVGGPQASAPASTQMFGAVSAPQAPAAAPKATQMFGAVGTPQAPAPAAMPKVSQGFGSGPQQSPASHGQTVMFGAQTPAAAPPKTTQPMFEPPQVAPRTTDAQFAALPKIGAAQVTPVDDEAMADTLIRTDPSKRTDPNMQLQASRDVTQPGIPGPAMMNTPAQPIQATAAPADLGGTPTIPIPAFQPARIDLPPEAPALLSGAAVSNAALEAPSAPRSKLPLVLGLLAALAIVGAGVAGRAVLKRPKAVPAEAVTRREHASVLMRRDDGASRERAIQDLVALGTAYPTYLPAKADLVLALALQLDDGRLESARLDAEAAEVNAKIDELTQAKVPSDWLNRVNALNERLAEIKRASEPLTEKAAALEATLDEHAKALSSMPLGNPDDELAAVRAQAIASGVKGVAEAQTLAQRYNALGGTGGWGEIALAEYAVNAKVSPDLVSASRAQLAGLVARDTTFFRAYVLSARLSFALKQNDVAPLENVIALNPTHEIARQLLDWHQPQR